MVKYMYRVYREELINDFRYIEYEDFQLERPSYMLIGLPDAGLVSVISAYHIIRKLDLMEVGGVDSHHLPPIAVIHKGIVRPPIRIFAKKNLLLLYSELLPPTPLIPSLINSILDYSVRKGVDYVLCMTGLPIPNRIEVEKLRSFYIPSNQRVAEFVKNAGIELELFENGYIVGPYALLIKEAIRRRMNALVILTESFMEFPDPEASAKNIEIFSALTGLKVDVKELIEEAEVIRIKAREHMKRIMPNLAQMRKEYEYAPPLYT